MDIKDLAVEFLTMCALKSPKEAFEKFVGPDFKHHNQYFAGDRDALVNAMIESDKEQPNRSFTVRKVYVADNEVAVHSRVMKDEMEIAVVHMLRIENSKIVEMWDVGQVLEKNSPNENGMF